MNKIAKSIIKSSLILILVWVVAFFIFGSIRLAIVVTFIYLIIAVVGLLYT